MAAPLLANLDADTRAAFDAAVARMKAAGVTVLDVDMPKLMDLNGAARCVARGPAGFRFAAVRIVRWPHRPAVSAVAPHEASARRDGA